MSNIIRTDHVWFCNWLCTCYECICLYPEDMVAIISMSSEAEAYVCNHWAQVGLE